MEEHFDIENDYLIESLNIYKKIRRRTIIVIVFYLLTMIGYIFDDYKDFDVVFRSGFFRFLLTLSVLMTITNIVLGFFKSHYNKEKMFLYLKRNKEIYELMSVIPIFISIVVFFNAFILSPAVIEGPSMQPNYYDGDTVFIAHHTSYDRFDTVILKVDNDSGYSYYIKRIIGLPGETVTISNDTIFITTSDGTTFELNDTTTIPNNAVTTCLPGSNQDTTTTCSFTVGENEYFVLGDNRQQSTDSRTIGAIKEEDLYGEVIFKIDFFD